jgi:tetratricopeptide (TPR) repeat protein
VVKNEIFKYKRHLWSINMVITARIRDSLKNGYLKYVAMPIAAFSVLNAVESGLENKVKDTPAQTYIGGSADAGELYSAQKQAISYANKLTAEAQIHYNKGLSFSQSNKIDEAISEFSKASMIESDNPAVYDVMANAFKKKGDFELALINYQKALSINENFSQSHLGIAMVYVKLGDSANVKKHINKYLELSPDTPYHKLCDGMIK